MELYVDVDERDVDSLTDSDELDLSDDEPRTSSGTATATATATTIATLPVEQDDRDTVSIPVEPEPDDSTEPKRADFMSLPTEILLEIFSYMDFGDLLELRSTCTKWNNVISSWNQFTQNATFNVIRGEYPYNESLDTLEASTIAWNEVVLEDFSDPLGPFNNFQTYLPRNLTSLVLVECSFTWSWILKVTASPDLPLLHKLSIVKCKRTVEEDEGWFQPQSLIDGFSGFRKRITHLKLTGDDTSTLDFFMRQFTFEKSGQGAVHPLVLQAFEVSVHPNMLPNSSHFGDGPTFGPTFNRFSDSLSKLISACWKTLKSLKIYTCFNVSTFVYRCLVELAEKEIHLDLTTFYYQWLDSDRHAFARIFEPDEVKLAKFLTSQLNLKSLGLPRVGKSGRFTGSLLPNLIPAGLEELDVGVARSRLSMDIFKSSSALKTVKLTTQHFDGPFAFINRNEDNYQFEQVKSFTLCGRGFTADRYYINFVIDSFPFLDTLIINSTGESGITGITDDNIQKIIKNLPLLTVLTLTVSKLVSDFGVAGIRLSDSNKILHSRSLYLEQDLETLGVCQTGVPLCSLEFLREVSFICTECDITDVGIQYGFKFKNLRKLNIVLDYELSDWGLVQLARLNPLLTECSVVTNSTILTPECKALFRKLLPRVKRNLSIVSAILPPITGFEGFKSGDSSSGDESF